MAKFYGTVSGNRGIATRCGTKDSGISTSAQSWDGSVIISLSYDSQDKLMLSVETSEDSQMWGGNRKFYGTLDEFNKIMDLVNATGIENVINMLNKNS